MKDIIKLLVALTLIAAISGLILSVVEKATREPIAAQRKAQMVKALSAVLPDFDNSPDTDTVVLENGVDKKGKENYQLSLGGSEAEDVSLAKITGPGFDEDGVVQAVETVTDVYLAQREEGERFLDTYRRIGMEPFKEALYG